MAAQLGGEMMGFIQRYHIVKQQRDSTDDLIRVRLLIPSSPTQAPSQALPAPCGLPRLPIRSMLTAPNRIS